MHVLEKPRTTQGHSIILAAHFAFTISMIQYHAENGKKATKLQASMWRGASLQHMNNYMQYGGCLLSQFMPMHPLYNSAYFYFECAQSFTESWVSEMQLIVFARKYTGLP